MGHMPQAFCKSVRGWGRTLISPRNWLALPRSNPKVLHVRDDMLAASLRCCGALLPFYTHTHVRRLLLQPAQQKASGVRGASDHTLVNTSSRLKQHPPDTLLPTPSCSWLSKSEIYFENCPSKVKIQAEWETRKKENPPTKKRKKCSHT